MAEGNVEFGSDRVTIDELEAVAECSHHVAELWRGATAGHRQRTTRNSSGIDGQPGGTKEPNAYEATKVK